MRSFPAFTGQGVLSPKIHDDIFRKRSQAINGTVFTKTKRKLNTDYRAELETLLSEMERCEARMKAHHAAADRLEGETEHVKAETKAIAAKIDVKLAELREQVSQLSRAK